MYQGQRPPGIRTTTTDDASRRQEPPMERESSLLPGEVRTPSYIVTMSDWAAPGSTVWDEDVPNSQQSIQTPLTGYGHQSDVWGEVTADVLPDELDPAAVEAAAGSQVASVPLSAVNVAAATLRALSPHGLPTPPLRPQPSVFSTNAAAMASVNPAGAGGPAGVDRGSAAFTQGGRAGGGVYTDPAPQPFFTVQEGGQEAAFGMGMGGAPRGARPMSLPPSRGMGSGSAGPAFTSTSPNVPGEGGGDDTNNGSGGGGGRRFSYSHLPSLEDKTVASSIIASAGLPLSMGSLVEYIRQGQPHMDRGGGFTVTTAHRNFPNQNEPPPPGGSHNAAMAGGGMMGDTGPFRGGGMDYGPGGGFGGRGGRFRGRGGPAGGGYGQESGGGGWNVQADTAPSGGGGYPPYRQGPNAGPYAFRGGRGGNNNNEMGGTENYGHGGNRRPKTESEILSDLLHFHANYFPPPPPPRVPPQARRSRAELWYHYANKWDLTHRLPPPPRTPLPEMELEFRMRLQELTRVPYHGDGWLQMSERWFDVMQSLFDYPDENLGEEVDVDVILEQAITA